MSQKYQNLSFLATLKPLLESILVFDIDRFYSYFTFLVTLFISFKLHNRVYIDRKLSVNCNCTWVSTLTWADFFSVTQKCNGMEMEHIHWVYCRFLANAKRRIICEWKLTISGVHYTKQGRRSWVGNYSSTFLQGLYETRLKMLFSLKTTSKTENSEKNSDSRD